jgi:hypothetical protein
MRRIVPMRHAALALAFLALPAAAWAQEVPSLWRGYDDAEPQEEPAQEAAEGAPEDPEAGNTPPVMEYIFWNSRIEGGMLYTLFDKDLDIEPSVGFYARYLLHLDSVWTVSVAYRHYSGQNSDLPGSEEEWLLIRSLLVGGGVRASFSPEFGVEGSLGTGAIWYESRHAGEDNDAGWIVSGDAAFVVRLNDMLKIKLGAALDYTRTDFHQDSRENLLGLSGLLSVEIGGH